MIIPIKLEKRTEGEREAYAEGYAAGKRDAVRIGRDLCDTPTLFWCSECDWSTGDTYPADRFNYCPMCGAKMK